MAEHGDNKGVDMLVNDIYGRGYDQMNLKGIEYLLYCIILTILILIFII